MKVLLCFLLLFLPATINAEDLKPEPQTSPREAIRVFVPGNLKQVVMEISRVYQARNPESKVIIESANPNDLSLKLKAGASGDVIIADEKFMEAIKEFVDPSTSIVAFSNPMVAVTDEASEIEWKKPSDINPENMKKIALLKPTSLIGKQTRAFLNNIGLKDALTDKTLEVKNVKEAVEKTRNGEAKWTIIHSTDASRRKVKRLFTIPTAEIPETTYSYALLSSSKQKEDASEFVGALQSVIAQKLFENAGFAWKIQRAPEPQTQTKPKKKKKKD